MLAKVIWLAQKLKQARDLVNTFISAKEAVEKMKYNKVHVVAVSRRTVT